MASEFGVAADLVLPYPTCAGCCCAPEGPQASPWEPS